MALTRDEEVRLVDLSKNVELTPSELVEKQALEEKRKRPIEHPGEEYLG